MYTTDGCPQNDSYKVKLCCASSTKHEVKIVKIHMLLLSGCWTLNSTGMSYADIVHLHLII